MTDWPTTGTAWDFIGYDGDGYLRIRGGRALYETVIYNEDTPGTQVRLARLAVGDGGIRQINRWIDPDTIIDVVDPASVTDDSRRPV